MLRLRPLLTLAVAVTLAWGALFYSFGAILARERGLAMPISIALLASALSAPPVGRAMARFGSRRVMIAGSFVAIAAFVALAFERSFAAFVALGVAQAMTLYEPAFAALVGWYPDARRRRRSIVVVTVLGAFAGPIFIPLSTWTFDRHGWATTMLAGAALLAIVGGLFASLPDTRNAATASVEGSPARVRTEPALVVVFAVQSFVATGVTIHLVAQIGMLAAFAGLAQIAGRVVLGALPDAMPTRTRVALLLAMQAVAIPLLGAAPVAGVVLFGAANGALTVERPLVIVEWAGERAQPLVSAKVASAAALARAGAPAAVAAFAAWTGLELTFGLLATGLFLAAVMFSVSMRAAWPGERASRSSSSCSSSCSGSPCTRTRTRRATIRRPPASGPRNAAS